MPDPVIIEAAINGATPKARNPNSPRTPAEVAADGLSCLAAGAAIVHNHNDEPVVGGVSEVHAPEPYIEAWRAILAARPDALLYPTMASGGPGTDIEKRYAHIPALHAAGVCRIGLIDAGSVNVGPMSPEGVPDGNATYINTFADARHMFSTCLELGLAPSISIFEPGFLRVALAYYERRFMPRGALVKLYFGANNWGLPPTPPSLDAYLAMLEGTGLPWSVALLGGDILETELARYALRKGGHLRVGLEDYAGPTTPSNVELVERAVALCQSEGRSVASCQEAEQVLGMP